MRPDPPATDADRPRAGRAAARAGTLAVMEGDTFVFSDARGDIDDRSERGHGLYPRDTRFLSRFRMRLSGREPALRSSRSDLPYLGTVELTDPPPHRSEEGRTALRPMLHVRRTRLVGSRVFERIRLQNDDARPVEVELSIDLAADFADVFEVRGLFTGRRGVPHRPEARGDEVTFRYDGRDGRPRMLRVRFDPEPAEVSVRGRSVHARFPIRLGGRRSRLVSVTFDPSVGKEAPGSGSFGSTRSALRRSCEDWERSGTVVATDDEGVGQLLRRGLRDLRGLSLGEEEWGVAGAGVPWFAAVFGLDSIIASLELLAVTAEPARNTLLLLAEHQGTREDPRSEEEPGKILHELRPAGRPPAPPGRAAPGRAPRPSGWREHGLAGVPA